LCGIFCLHLYFLALTFVLLHHINLGSIMLCLVMSLVLMCLIIVRFCCSGRIPRLSLNQHNDVIYITLFYHQVSDCLMVLFLVDVIMYPVVLSPAVLYSMMLRCIQGHIPWCYIEYSVISHGVNLYILRVMTSCVFSFLFMTYVMTMSISTES